MPVDSTGLLETDKWSVYFNGQRVGFADEVTMPVSIETVTTTATIPDFSCDFTFESRNAPDIYEMMKRLFGEIPAKMLPNHIWSNHCRKIRARLRKHFNRSKQ